MAIEGRDAIASDDAIPAEMEDEAGAVGGGGPADAEMGASEAIAALPRGAALRDVRVVDLRFKGEFPLPVRLERVELIQPKFEGAEFRDEVAFDRCKLVKPTSGKGCTFARGLDLRGSTLVRALFRNLAVGGPLRCDGMRTFDRFQVIKGTFGDRVRFWDARFSGWVEFDGCTFAGEADFRS